jgi:hypothetical protein
MIVHILIKKYAHELIIRVHIIFTDIYSRLSQYLIEKLLQSRMLGMLK